MLTIEPIGELPPGTKSKRAEDMKTVAFVTQKGGSGKSTLASSLGVAAMEQGEKVCIIDLDPQASLVSWSKTRGLDDVPVVASNAAKLSAALDAFEKKGFTLAIIDTPGADGAASIAAMKAADLNIIPSRPSAFDLWASAHTRAALKDVGGRLRFPAQPMPAGSAVRAGRRGRRRARSDGRSDFAAGAEPRRLSGSRPSRLGRDRDQRRTAPPRWRCAASGRP